MADAAVSALVNFVFEKLADEVFNKYARAQGIHSELEKLGGKLYQVKALLYDASDKEIKEETVKQWLNRLQHAAYDIEDVLDDVATEAMRLELAQESSGASTSKVRNLIVPTCCTNFTLSHRLSSKIDRITTNLQQLYTEKSELGLTVKEKQKDSNRGNETSLLESYVVGRQSEKQKFLNKLLGGESSEEKFSIIPIVGMGGVGKTTLARFLYNDPQVQTHFPLKAWVCVSDDFDIFKISKTIFQAMSGERKKFEDLNQLQIDLTDQFKDKRFLLVLDDVWTENYDLWEKLARPLNFGAPGSKIIITTRKNELLKMLGFDHLDLIESLSSEDALSLFAFHALGEDNFDSYPDLREKGKAIVQRCGTLPLALKAIGRLLRSATKEKWDDVLNSNIWDSKYVGDLSADWKVIFPALMISYHDLSANLKRLFAYCSLFPKDFLFNKEELVLLWMAEGFLNQSTATKSQEDFGREDFEALLSRSFFQHAPNDESLYVMHDLMNDLATFVAEEFFLRFENHTKPGNEGLTRCRHMSFVHEKYEAYQKFEPFKRASSLRTLMAVSVDQNQNWFYFSSKILVDLLSQLPLLRVLSLTGSRISEVPDFIGSLKHLRYLNLSQSRIEKLPENIGNLFNLHTLIIFGCKYLTKLPKSFSKLKKLRHFDIRDTRRLNKLPLGIGELKSLQILSNMVIGTDDGFAITELKGLNNLHGELSVVGLSKVESAMDIHEVKLSLKRLTKLHLNWGDGSQHGTLEKEVLKELEPDSKWLKRLSIDSYPGIEFPEWVGHPSFHQLVHVSITNCTSLPPLGQLPSLKELYISGMEVMFIGSEFSGTNHSTVPVLPYLRELHIEKCFGLIKFSHETTNSDVSVLPSLKELHITSCLELIEFSPEKLPKLEILWFEDMLGWKIWSTKDAVFPCLRELDIANCPQLVEVSAEALPLLRLLRISECGGGVLRSLVQAAPSISMLDIRYISGLTYEVWSGVMKHIGAVEEVRILACNEIKYLWESEEEASKVLVNIKKLEVSKCSNLVSLGEKEEEEEDNFGSSLLTSLRTLDVHVCDKMERCCCPDSIESLHIKYCSSLTHVSFPTSATGGGGKKLKSLDIVGCSKLMEKINNISTGVLERIYISGWTNLKSMMQLGNFIYLTQLSLYNCPSLESFPDIPLSVLTHLEIEKCERMESFPDIPLPVLTHLKIVDCERMESFSTCQMNNNLTSLKELVIRDCPSIDASCHGGVWPPNLCSLEIGRLKNPMSEWGPQSFPSSLVDLELCYDADVKNFSQLSHLSFPSSLTKLEIDNFEKLESLSMGLQHLTSLQQLYIYDCPKMKHLPKHLLPSLLSLEIYDCPKLRKRCEGRGSHYYPLTSHIPQIDFYPDNE